MMQKISYLGVPSRFNDELEFSFLDFLPYISSVDASRTKLTDAALATLQKHPEIHQLHLEETSLTGEGFQYLTELKNLGTLALGNARNVRPESFTHLSGLGNLKWLYLADTQVDDVALAHLRELKKLWLLDLAGTAITDESLGWIGSQASLNDLCLNRTRVTSEGLSELTGLKTLTILRLDRTSVTDAGLAHVAELENLTTLNLVGTPVTDEGLKSLYGLKKLRTLTLGETKVSVQGVTELKKALPACTIDWKP